MAERTEREVLNHLIEACRDGEMEFRSAADHVEDPAVRTLLLQMADERAQYAAELLPHAQRLGGAAPHDGTSMGSLRRHWIDIKSMLRPHNAHTILVEVARGDRVTVDSYRDAIEGMLPPDTRDLVEQQYSRLQKEHDRIAEVDHEQRVH